MKIILWTGGNAPSRNSQLAVSSSYPGHFSAIWEPGYCGCEDCRGKIIVGEGSTEAEAISDYWTKWEEEYGDELS